MYCITSQPPTYNKLVELETRVNSFYETKVVTRQPQRTYTNFLDEFEILGVNKNSIGLTKSFILSNNYLVFNKVNTLKYTNKLIVINTDETTKNNVVRITDIPLNTNNISLNPNNKNIVINFGSNKYSKISLLSNQNIQQDTNLKNDVITNDIKYNLPVNKIYSISYDSNGDLYAVCMQANRLALWKKKGDAIDTNNVFKKITNIPYYGIINIQFSDFAKHLFILQKDDILTVLSNHSNWSKTSNIMRVTSFPVDVDSSSELLIFIDNNKLELKGLEKRIKFSINLDYKITTACFINDTKDLLIFSENKNVVIAKYINDNKWQVDKKNIITLDQIIHKARFNPNNKNQLITLLNTKKIDLAIKEYAIIGALIFISETFVNMIFECRGVPLCDAGICIHLNKFFCGCFCKNIVIGAGIASGFIAILAKILRKIDRIKTNKVSTNLIKLKTINNNVINQI